MSGFSTRPGRTAADEDEMSLGEREDEATPACPGTRGMVSTIVPAGVRDEASALDDSLARLVCGGLRGRPVARTPRSQSGNQLIPGNGGQDSSPAPSAGIFSSSGEIAG
jgi:hypothetical protein